MRDFIFKKTLFEKLQYLKQEQFSIFSYCNRLSVLPDGGEHGHHGEQSGDGEHHPGGHLLEGHEERQPRHDHEHAGGHEGVQEVVSDAPLKLYLDVQPRVGALGQGEIVHLVFIICYSRQST